MSSPAPADDPLELLDRQYVWYRSHAVKAGQRYKVLEVSLLVFAAAVPVSAVVSESWVTASLGAVVVVLTGLRSIFSWQDDWLRFTEAWQQLEFARTLYVNRMAPYDDAATRVSALVTRVQGVQASETRGWLALRADANRADQAARTTDAARAARTTDAAPQVPAGKAPDTLSR